MCDIPVPPHPWIASRVKNPKCHPYSHPEVGSLLQLQSFTAAPVPKQVLFPGNQDDGRVFLGQRCPPCSAARCAPQLVAPAAGGSSPRARLMDGFSQQEIAGSSSADPSAAPCSPFFPFPAELGILVLSSRLRKAWEWGWCKERRSCTQEIGTSWWDLSSPGLDVVSVLPNLPGIIITSM